MPVGYSIWLFLKNNPLARWLLAIGTGLAAFRIWLGLRDKRIIEQDRVESTLQAERTARQVIDEARIKTDDTIKAAEAARDAIPDGPTADSLPDAVSTILFSNYRRDRD